MILRLLWSRFSWRHCLLAPASSALLVAILAIGVAVYFSIRLANRAAVASFQSFTEILTTESDGLITSPAGKMSESILREVRAALDAESVDMIPILEGDATPPRTREDEEIGERSAYQILGLDLVALSCLGTQKSPVATDGEEGASAAPKFLSAFRDPHAVFITESLARKQKLAVGDRLPVIMNESVVDLRVGGIIPAPKDQPAPPAHLLFMDLPALQQLMGRPGELDRVEFIVTRGPERAQQWKRIATILTTLGKAEGSAMPRWTVSTPADRRESAATMTTAFRLNLTILSLIALLVGLSLVFQALDGAVVRRREEIAILRSLGVRARTIQLAWLIEATVLGVVGGVLGLVLGGIGAQFAVRFVGRTVNALYHATSADAAAVNPGEAAVALAVSVLASLIAGWAPARTAAHTPPAQIASRGSAAIYGGGKWLQQPWIGVGLIVLGGLLANVPPLRFEGGTRVSLAAYGAAFLWVIGAGLLAGPFLAWLARISRGWGAVSVPLRLALSQLRAPSGRHRLAAASLVCAVAMTAGMAILVGSFSRTMTGWIARTFQADLYISSDAAQSASAQGRITGQTWKRIAANPAVAELNAVHYSDVQLAAGSTMLVGAQMELYARLSRPAWIQAPEGNDVFDPKRNAGLALVSESFCERFVKQRGDLLLVPTPSGAKELRIAGTFSDYGNERGSILVEGEHFRSWFRTDLAVNLIVVLKKGTDADAVRAALRAEYPGLGIFTNAHLRREALRIFQQTFAITYALEFIGVVVAVAGLAFTLASLLWERRSDLATLRAIGLRRAELALAAAWEGAITATGSAIVGLLASLALGWLLVFRINKQTFGWTLQPDVPWLLLASLATLVIFCASLTGWCIGRWGARLPAEREE